VNDTKEMTDSSKDVNGDAYAVAGIRRRRYFMIVCFVSR
jgi:hypothetical protein